MADIQPKPYTILPVVQHYAWGAKGKDALIPKLLGIEPDKEKAYAELWYGDHPKSPSHIVDGSSSVSMNTWISRDPETILGEAIANRFNSRLPFLFKVLSANEPLSIQAHPNKEQAEDLHRIDPLHYPDDNHKPEIAIALDSLESLCGVLSGQEIMHVFDAYPEITRLVFKTDIIASEQVIGREKAIIRSLINTSVRDSDAIADCNRRLKTRLQSKKTTDCSKQERLYLDMLKTYDFSDVGLIFIFLLKYFKFEQSEGLFMDAGIPHAYLHGNIVECMANSDNVVRVGLTPKFKDARSLSEILVIAPEKTITYPEAKPGETIYAPPVEEFRIHRYETSDAMSFPIDTRWQVEMGILLKGSGELVYGESQKKSLEIGQAFCIPACLSGYEIKMTDDSLLFRITIP